MKNIKENFLFIPYYAYDDMENRFEKFKYEDFEVLNCFKEAKQVRILSHRDLDISKDIEDYLFSNRFDLSKFIVSYDSFCIETFITSGYKVLCHSSYYNNYISKLNLDNEDDIFLLDKEFPDVKFKFSNIKDKFEIIPYFYDSGVRFDDVSIVSIIDDLAENYPGCIIRIHCRNLRLYLELPLLTAPYENDISFIFTYDSIHNLKESIKDGYKIMCDYEMYKSLVEEYGEKVVCIEDLMNPIAAKFIKDSTPLLITDKLPIDIDGYIQESISLEDVKRAYNIEGSFEDKRNLAGVVKLTGVIPQIINMDNINRNEFIFFRFTIDFSEVSPNLSEITSDEYSFVLFTKKNKDN